MLILTEGTVTEVRYFRALVQHNSIQGVDICAAKVPDPLKMLSEGIAARNADPELAVWLVLDAEEPADVVRRRRLAKMLPMADKAGIRCVISWPCFELWLLLHEEASGDLPMDTRQITSRLRTLWQTSRIKQDFPVYQLVVSERIETARRRARTLRKHEPELPAANTKVNRTDVDLLVESVLKKKA